MKKLLSYIWPISQKMESNYSGQLSLTLINGRKYLDSQNANYSYGSLQHILEMGLKKIDLKNTNSILLLGLGGGSIIKSLRNRFGFKGQIHAIDFDEKIISIALNEFNIQASPNLVIENKDAFEYVKNCKSIYDLVIVDLFIDDQVPSQFYSTEFCENLSKLTSLNGKIVFNLGINNQNKMEQLQVINFFKNNISFNCTIFEKVEGTNTLAIFEKQNRG